MSVRSRERAAHRAFDVGRRRLQRRQIHRTNRLTPQRVVGAADEEALQRELRGLRGGFGGGQVLAARRGFRLRLHDVERRQRADFDARLVVFDQLVGQLGGALRDVDGALREDQIPVGVAHVGQRLRDRGARALFGDVAVDHVDRQLLPHVVDLEAAQQRLHVARRPGRGVERIARRERVRRRRPAGSSTTRCSCRRTADTSCAIDAL